MYWSEHPLAKIHHDDPERGIARLAESAERVFAESLSELEQLLTSTNPFAALADFALYGLLAHHGSDPELPENPPVLQHHVELVQALALKHKPAAFSMEPCTPDVFQRLHEVSARTFEAFTIRRVDWVAEPSQSREALQRRWIQKAIQDDTAILRNWGYATQVFRMLRSLFEPIDSKIQLRKGFRVSALISMFDKLTKLRANVLNDVSRRVRQIQTTTSVEAALDMYRDVAPLARAHDVETVLSEVRKHGMTLKQVQRALMVEAMASLHVGLYTFTLKDFTDAYGSDIAPEVMATVADMWSLRLGDLSDTPVDRLFLANPIWHRPMIKHGDKYFWSILGLFHSFPLEMCVPLFADDTDLLSLYEERRAKFTEEETLRLLKEAFPEATVVANSCWTDRVSGVEYENDALAIVGSHVIVVEAKGGKFSAPARRGAERSLERHLADIVVEAKHQATRFAQHLAATQGRQEFRRRDGGINTVEIPVGPVLTPLVVTFESLGAIGTRSTELQNSGFTRSGLPSVPSIALPDLEVVLDVLRGPSQKLHYITRRAEIEARVLYMADELDLLAFYLWTGFNIGEVEFDGRPLNLWGMSKCLDYYFTREHFGVEVKPIRQRLSAWWDQLLSTVESRQFDSWSVVGSAFLNVNYEDQLEFEQRIRGLKRALKKGGIGRKRFDMIALHNGPPQRREMIGAVVYRSLPREERRNRVGQAAENMLANEPLASLAIAIGIDADGSESAYDLIAVVKRGAGS